MKKNKKTKSNALNISIKDRADMFKIKPMFKYFEDNNLAVGNSYKVFEARYKISVIFDKHIYHSETAPIIITELIDDLRLNLKSLKILHAEAKNREGNTDSRSGEESYGYANIDGDLLYVSDRWFNQFRLRWIIDLINR